GELPLLDQHGERFVAEARQDAGHPGAVPFRHASERWIRVARFPALGIEVFYLVVAKHLARGTKTGGIPGPFTQAEREPVFKRILQVQVVGVPEAAAELRRLPDAAEAVAKIEYVVAYIALVLTGLDPHRERVHLACVEMLRPG